METAERLAAGERLERLPEVHGGELMARFNGGMPLKLGFALGGSVIGLRVICGDADNCGIAAQDGES